MKSAAPALSLVVALTACATTSSSEGTPPPPRGKTMDEYVRDVPPERKSAPEGTVAADSMTLHAIDFGQGTAILLEFPCAAVLVDTGGEQNEQFDSVPVLTEYLDRLVCRLVRLIELDPEYINVRSPANSSALQWMNAHASSVPLGSTDPCAAVVRRKGSGITFTPI